MTKFFSKAFRAAQGHCTYCCKNLMQDFDTFWTAQEDHLIPRKHQGTDEQSNIVIACFVCNNLRGSFMPSDEKVDYFAPNNREKLIDSIRAYVMKRRAEEISESYAGWTRNMQRLKTGEN